MKKYCIIGGVAGGATFAARLRRLDEHAKIILFERGEHVSFANCGLPYYIGGTIPERESLFLMSPEGLQQRLNIEVRIMNEVTSVLPETKEIRVRDLATGDEYTENYDTLLMSPGAEPLRPPIDGIGSEKIFTLRNVPDSDAIKSFVDEKKPKKAVVVGGGFIGLEMAENLHSNGIDITIVEMADQVMAPLDYEMAAIVHDHLSVKGVELCLGDRVVSFKEQAETIVIKLESGRTIDADMVVLSIGVRPESKLARECGLKLTENGAILVNEFMQSSDPDIYAVGDAVAFKHPLSDDVVNTLLAGPANRQARIAADNCANGNKRSYKGAINTAIAKVFDITVASTGLSEKYCKKAGIAYVSNIIHAGNHAGYYPGAIPLTIKTVFDPDSGTVLGAQAVGYEGVDKRIDVMASVVGRRGTVYDLQDFEHTYAPPYSSAKDPVNVCGYSAGNILSGLVSIVNWNEIEKYKSDGALFLDVRTEEEFELGSIDGSINIPVDSLRERLDEIPKEKTIIVFCQVGLRGYLAVRIMKQNGYNDLFNLSGGYKVWSTVFRPTPLSKGESDNSIVAEADGKIHANSLVVDACGMQCPGPIVQLKKSIDKIADGETLQVKATDPGFMNDVGAWCSITGHSLISVGSDNGIITAVIKKITKQSSNQIMKGTGRDKTLVLFSDDFDRALALFVIATGAASTGAKVTLFFTFWGLNLLKKKSRGRIKKDFISRMFGFLMPKGSRKTKLSKMHMMGAGTAMMRRVMKKKNVTSLEDMMREASEDGVIMLACQMSMDIMGVKKEELYDFVQIGGVAAYLAATESADLNLFI
ncbi:MAG: FAD-dependent oxidoreductase [Spirochaetes bacterium]|jgi:NADPH-dependent 2,4-dienoyl-CoA reductase/sulfur reductase-like enzyme/peroxiredoxin family protein/rhodanese-related sulfurtransferase/TusA-related sulfurtransferase|nr:FAD-dependent oxidoreductase [Spirochaetota bacterium]